MNPKILFTQLVFALLIGLSFKASAQAGPSTEELAKAEQRFAEGEAYYDLGKYAEALAAYEDAYLLSKAPELLYNTAQCYRLLGNYEEAIKRYNTYLRRVPDSPIRVNVEKLIAESEASLRAGPTPSTAKVGPTSAPIDTPGPSLARFVLPAGLAVLGVGLGASFLVFEKKTESQGGFGPSRRQAGIALALSADLSFVTSGVTLFLALRKKPTKQDDAAVGLSPIPGGALLSFTTTLSNPSNQAQTALSEEPR